jgi:tetratricopeptide (TPR) repeat protein
MSREAGSERQADVALAGVLARSGRGGEALSVLDGIAERLPDDGDAHLELGRAVMALGLGAAAAAGYEQRRGLSGADGFRACIGLGALMTAEGRLAAAEQPLRDAVRLAPGHTGATDLLVRVLLGLGRSIDGALPAEALGEVGFAYLTSKRRLPEAVAVLEAAVRQDPSRGAAERRHLLGHAQAALGLSDAAAASFAAAERDYRANRLAEPGNVAGWARLAALLYYLGRPAEAVDWAEAAGEEDILADTMGWALMAAGRHLDGLVALAAHRRRGRAERVALWDGRGDPGATVVVTNDRGFGDFLQFCRFVPLAAERARIVLEVPAELAPVAATIQGVDRVVALGEVVGESVLYCPLSEVGAVLAPALPAVPAVVPYIRASAMGAKLWRDRLARLPGRRRAGIAWQGNRTLTWDAWRSVPVERLAPLAGVEGVALVSLQVGEPAPFWAFDAGRELGDFADTAELVEALDLVISVDTAVAHLAGAMAKPVWLLNRFSAEGRWEARGEGSVWYPTLRQFRQSRPGDWDGVIARVREELAAWVA